MKHRRKAPLVSSHDERCEHLDRADSRVDLRTALLERGMSHSGEAHSFSPSELLLWPSSSTEELDDSLARREGRPSSSFPSTDKTTTGHTSKSEQEVNKETASGRKLTSLFLRGPRLWDDGVVSFGGEAPSFVLQWRYVRQLQRTENQDRAFIKNKLKDSLALFM